MSLQHTGISLSQAAKIVTIVSLSNFHFVLASTLVHDSITSMLFSSFLISVKFTPVATSLDHSNSVFFSCAE